MCFQAFNHKPNTCPSIDHACKDVRVFSSQGLSGSSRSGTSGLKRARMTPYHFEFPQASSSVAFVSPPGITIITIIIAYQFTRSPQKLTFSWSSQYLGHAGCISQHDRQRGKKGGGQRVRFPDQGEDPGPRPGQGPGSPLHSDDLPKVTQEKEKPSIAYSRHSLQFTFRNESEKRKTHPNAMCSVCMCNLKRKTQLISFAISILFRSVIVFVFVFVPPVPSGSFLHLSSSEVPASSKKNNNNNNKRDVMYLSAGFFFRGVRLARRGWGGKETSHFGSALDFAGYLVSA